MAAGARADVDAFARRSERTPRRTNSGPWGVGSMNESTLAAAAAAIVQPRRAALGAPKVDCERDVAGEVPSAGARHLAAELADDQDRWRVGAARRSPTLVELLSLIMREWLTPTSRSVRGAALLASSGRPVCLDLVGRAPRPSSAPTQHAARSMSVSSTPFGAPRGQQLDAGEVLARVAAARCLYSPPPHYHCVQRRGEGANCSCAGRFTRRCAGRDFLATLEDPLPLHARPFWLHVPKCGSSFINTFLGLCSGLPRCARLLPGDAIFDFDQAYRPQAFCDWARIGAHNGMDNTTLRSSRGLLMLRQPEQRLVSGYYQLDRNSNRPGLHGYSGNFGQHGIRVGHVHLRNGSWHVASQRSYAEALQGCAVRMLTRSGSSACETPPLPSQEEVSLAIGRLRTNFAFVGITEQWKLSICLAHIMFRMGPCDSSEFVNSRKGAKSNASGASTGGYDLEREGLSGYRDPFDGPLYEAANHIFQEKLRKYDISPARCKAFGCSVD